MAATACSVIAVCLRAVFRYGVRGLSPAASAAVLHIGVQAHRLPLRPLPQHHKHTSISNPQTADNFPGIMIISFILLKI
jgi:hypothetical protein